MLLPALVAVPGTQRARLFLVVLLTLLLTGPLFGAKPRKGRRKPDRGETSFEGKPADVFKTLKARLQEPSADRERLRLDLIIFRRTFPGSPQALAAARLLRALPGPLEKLDARAIPPLDRYDWQPKGLVAVLGEHRGRQGSPVTSVAWSPDGTLIASGGSNGQVRLWDPATLRLKGILAHDSYVSGLAFRKDSQMLVASSYAGTVRVWDVSGDKPTLERTFRASTSNLYTVAIAPDGQTVACGGLDLMVRLWNIAPKLPKEIKVLSGHGKPVSSVAFSKSGRTLASADYKGEVRLWSVAVGDFKAKSILEGNTKAVYSLAFDAEGRLLAAGGEDGTVRVWTFTEGRQKLSAVLAPKAGAIYAVVFAPKGKRLALGCGDYNVHVWDVAGQRSRQRQVLKGHESYISSVAFNKTGTMLVSGSADWTTRLWSLAGKGKERFPARGHLSFVYSTPFAPDGKLLASGSNDRTIRLWQPTGQSFKERKLIRETVAVSSVAFTPNGKMVAGAGGSATVQLWNVITGRPVRKLSDFPGGVYSLTFTPDGSKALAIGLKLLCLWDVKTGRKIKTMDGHTINISAAALSPDGKQALTCAGTYKYDKRGQIVIEKGQYVYADCTVRLWDLVSGRQTHLFKAERPLNCVAFAADGSGAVSGDWYSHVQKYDLAKLAPAGNLDGKGGHVYYATYAPDGQTLATVGPDGLVAVWDLVKGVKLWSWLMAEEVRHVSFAPDSRYLSIGLGTGPVYIVRLAAVKE